MENDGKKLSESKTEVEKKNEGLEHWMSRLPATLRELPVIFLAIPGSHNSMTYTITRESSVGPDEPSFVRALGRYLSPVSKRVIFNWSVTQDRSLEEQLNSGVRYLDLRVASKPSDKRIYFLHGLYGSAVDPALKQISDWLAWHSGELVILDFQHFYSFAEEDHRQLVEDIRQAFRSKLCPLSSRFQRVTLNTLSSQRQQVLVVYRNAFAQSYSFLWPSGLWRTPWPNTVRVDQLVSFLDEQLKSRSLETGFVSQCLLTPDVFYVGKNLCGTLRTQLANRCQKEILEWIRRQQPGRGGLNVVIADFVGDDDYIFCKTVVECNEKLLGV